MSPLALLPFLLASVVLLVAWLTTRRRLQIERADRLDANRILNHYKDLESESALFKALSEAARSAIILINANRRIIYLNGAARQLFDVTTPAASHDTLMAATRHHEIDQLVTQALTGNEVLEAQVVLSSSTYRINVTPVIEGQRSYTSITLEDVTELQRLGRARRDMVANISHELRTPITSIRLLVDTLLRNKGQETKRSQELLAKIAIETDTLQQMAQELLDLAMIESGRAEFIMMPTDLGQIIAEVADQLAGQAERKQLSVKRQIPPNLLVVADATQVKRVLANLLHNAIKFTPPGGSITITARPRHEWVRTTVIDTGPGIALEERERVFERFYQGNRSRQGSGTGLGLAIAKHIVLAHGGQIWVEEPPSQPGACLCFTLPLAESLPT